jgi:hypothetical protein
MSAALGASAWPVSATDTEESSAPSYAVTVAEVERWLNNNHFEADLTAVPV